MPIDRRIGLANNINSTVVYLHWTPILIYLIVIIGTIVTALLDDRQPSETMAWLLILIFLPIVSIILHPFFDQNTRKQRMISRRSIDQLTKCSMLEFTEQKDSMLPEWHQPLIQPSVNQNMSLPFKDNEVEIHTEGTDFFLGLLRAIGSAKHHIYVDMYIVEEDPLSQLIANVLIDKAREGIEVRLIYDYVGCWKIPGRYFEWFCNAGVDVRSFMPVRFSAFTGKVNYRNHHELAVIDGQIGFTGGMNAAMRCIRGSVKQP